MVSLQFVLGPAKMDHRATMVEQLMAALTEQPRDQFFYLVPNHIKFDTEVDVLNRLAGLSKKDGMYAQHQVQVLSFTRLAWYLMKNEAAYQVPRLSAAGIDMLLYRILKQHQPELQLFGGEVTQTGFITQLAREVNELQVANLQPEDLQTLAQQTTSGDLGAKLHDLAIVYADFIEATAGKYLKPADVLAQLNAYLRHQDLSSVHVYLELVGFAQLPSQEQGIITTMLERGADVTVSLTLDHKVVDQLPETGRLFYQSGRLYYRLYNYARERHVKVLTDIQAKDLRVSHGLAVLDDFWRGHPQAATGQEQPNHQIEIMRTDSRQTELAQVGRKIRAMVAKRHENPADDYHYRDFLIMTRHLANYQTMLAPTLQQLEIPYFVDLQRSMADHPLVELIGALFDLQKSHYGYRDVMRILKTELILPQVDGQPMAREAYRQAVDLTENFILKSGYSGHRWTQREDWQYFQLNEGDTGVETDKNLAISKQINLIHHFVAATFPPFFKAIATAKNGREAATVLVNFLEQAGVTTQLLAWRDQALDRGDVATAAEPEQTWQTFCGMLDEYVVILGDESFVNEDFIALLKAGFEGASYSQIPSTLDQVLVSESGMVQSQDRKVVFMIGATDLVMPDRIVANNLLSDADKTALEPALTELGEGHFLNDSAVVQLADESCLNYLAFLSAQKHLIFSAPLKDDQESTLNWSPYVKRIQQHFKLPEVTYLNAPDPVEPDITPFVSTKRRTLSHVIQVYRDVLTTNADYGRQGAEIHPAGVWVWLAQQLRADTQFGPLAQRLLAGLDYRNEPQQLTENSVNALYGNRIYTSISKLEEYYRNPYAYFLKYGLKLRERDVFDLSPASTGEFFHAVLDGIIKAIRADHIPLAQVTDEKLSSYLETITKEVLAQQQFVILTSSNRMAYIQRQLVRTVRQVAFAIRNQSKRSDAQPVQTELLFGNVGQEHSLKSLDYSVDATHSVHVRGKIDRLDQIKVANQDYLGIVDYKSSAHAFDFGQAYYGLAMQMLTYLAAVLKNERTIVTDTTADIQLAGALYMHIQNPKLAPKDVTKGFEEALLKENKYQGILLNDPELLDHLDTEVAEHQGRSSVYPFHVRKSDKAYLSGGKNALVTNEELGRLLAHNEQLIVDAAREIFAGNVALDPIRLDDKTTALQYSPYLAIMQFDAMLPENGYHDLQPLKPAEVLALLRKEMGEK